MDGDGGWRPSDPIRLLQAPACIASIGGAKLYTLISCSNQHVRGDWGRVARRRLSRAISQTVKARASEDDVPQPRDRLLRPAPAERPGLGFDAAGRVSFSARGSTSTHDTTRHEYVRSRAGRVPGRGTVRSQPCTRQPHDDHARIRTGLPADA